MTMIRMTVAAILAWSLAGGRPAHADFPAGFRWGTAIAGFQSDMGGVPDNRDPGSDWWAWTHDAANVAAHRVSGDLPEDGPGFWSRYPEDLRNARKQLRSNTLRLSIEWSRIFPTSTAGVDISGGVSLPDLLALDALADQSAVAHYRQLFTAMRQRGLEPNVTLNHFTLPLWLHDPLAIRDQLAGREPDSSLPAFTAPAGWLDANIVAEFAKYAAYCGWKFGDLVDMWAPINEPVVVAVNGFVNVPGVLSGNFPPGAYSFTGAIRTIVNEAYAQGAAYDALHTWDTVDADGDGTPASVGIVHNMVAFHPLNPSAPRDVTGAQHASYIFNQVFPNAVILGDVDASANGTIDPGEHDPGLVGKADWFGVNYYLKAKAHGFPFSLSDAIPVLDFQPTISYRTPQNPTLPLCPTTCTEFGWEIYPQGLREVLQIAGGYGLPVFITENGIADGDDDQRPAYLVQHLQILEQAIADGVADVRGYYHWSLTDNFEWSSGYYPKFGLYKYTVTRLRRRSRRSAGDFARIARRNAIPPTLIKRFGLP